MEIKYEKKEAENKLDTLEAEKNKEIDELKFSLKQLDNNKQIAIAEAVKNIEKERDDLKHKLDKADLIRENSVSNLRDKYKVEIRHKEDQLKLRDDTIQELKNLKAQLSTKMVGETLEQHCENEFNSSLLQENLPMKALPK